MYRLKNLSTDVYWQTVICLFILLLAFAPRISHPFDTYCFTTWAGFISSHSIGHAYLNPEFNYPPLIAYPLWAAGTFFGSIENFVRYFYYFKIFTLAFDFAAVLLIIKWLGRREHRPGYVMLLLANPLFLYNTYCWGQVDGILAAFVLLSVYAVVIDNPILALVSIVLALNFKVQAIIFVPVLGLLIIWKLLYNWKVKQVVLAMAIAVLVQIIIVLPFILAGQLGNLVHVVLGSVGYFPVVSMNAYNIWYIVMHTDPMNFKDNTLLIAGLTYKQAGLLLFCIASFLILFPVFYGIIANKLKRQYFQLSTEVILLMFAAIPLMFFYFNTQMHERYSHPAIIFFAAYAVYTNRWHLLGLMLLAYGLNIEAILKYFNFPKYSIFIFEPKVSAAVYALLIFVFAITYTKALKNAYREPLVIA